jgi:hypothetical protein
MNVAVVEPASILASASGSRESELDALGVQSEWIDPEGDDWFSAIYRELTQGSAVAAEAQTAPELEHWFG